MTTPTPGGGLINNLLGGITGTLAGGNSLQSSIDQLNNTINRLISTNSGGYSGSNASFPKANSSSGNNANFGGGGGGTGNVRPPMPFNRIAAGVGGIGMLGSAFAGYGQQQMPFQLRLNAMASMSMMGTGMGMNQYSGFASMIGNQVVNPISASSTDALQLAQQLQFMAGTPRIMGSALGRAGFGAASAFGMTNPMLSGAAAGSLAQQIYNPALSMRMRMMGYGTTPRIMGSGMPQSIGNVVSSLLQGWYGKNKVSPSQLFRTLSMGGKGFTNLQYLGLNPQQMAPLMEGFNKLFNAGYSPEAASSLFSRAASNNPNISRVAQQQLTRAGVTSVSSDIQKLRNNQSQLTQRSVNTAAGFNAALTASTDSLLKFNSVLNSILSSTGLNGPLGALGGASGVLSGTNHGNFLNGLGGAGLLALAMRGGSSAVGGGALGSVLGRVGLGGAGLLTGGAGALGAIWAANNIHVGNKTLWQTGDPVKGHQTGWNSWSGLGHNLGNWFGKDPSSWLDSVFGGGFPTPKTGPGGGANSAPSPTSRQQSSKNLSSTNSGIGGAAIKAVNAAESQLGVPYVWGGEQPGVGFDCSGLVQWAYKQAGVNIPRRSQDQWAALRKRSVPTNQVQEGDLVFMAGSDGTPNSPGHVGMMISRNQLIEAPTTGQDVKIIGYDPKQWSHAARPSGGGKFLPTSGTTLNSGASALGLYGNAGIGMGIGNYGSANEVDLISSTGGFMGGAGGGFFSMGGLGGLMPTTGGQAPGSSIGNRGPKGNGSTNINAEKAYAMMLLKAHGWGNQFSALNSIIMDESGWRWNAANASGAYGIPQALPGSKMSSAGKDWRTNPDTQLRWMIDTYIPQRYGTPNNAWAFHQRTGYYSAGGMNVPPGFNWVGERGPELMFTGGGSNILSNAQSMALMKATTHQQQQSPWQTVSNQMKYGGQVITPGQPQSSSGGGINITFGQGSICVTVGNSSSGNSTSASDAQSAGKAIAQATVQHLENELLLSTIAQGIKG